MPASHACDPYSPETRNARAGITWFVTWCPCPQVSGLGQRGIRSLAVARQEEGGQWEMLGLLTFLDPPRPDTKDTIHRAMKYGVDVKMITGE